MTDAEYWTNFFRKGVILRSKSYINVDELVDAKIFPTRLGDNEYVQYQTFCHTCVNNTGVWAIPAKRVDFDFTVDWEYDEKDDGCKYKFRKKTGKVM